MSIALAHMLLAAPLASAMHTGQCPSPTQTQRLLLAGEILSYPNCKQWQRTDNNRAEECPPMPMSKRRSKELMKKSSVKTNNLTKPQRKHGQIFECHFRGGGSCGICKDSRAMKIQQLFCWTSKDLCLIYVSFCVLTTMLWWRQLIILAVTHLAVRCCSRATQLVAKSSL